MLLQFLAVSALLTLFPGPDILFVLAQSIRHGRHAAIAVALGLSSGLLIHTTAVATGVALWVSNNPEVLVFLRYAGVAYLTYLGIMSVISSYKRNEQNTKNSEESTQPQTNSNALRFWRLYRQGVTMNLLNPKVVLFFLSFFPGFITPESDNVTAEVMVMGGLFALQAAFIFTMVGLLGSVLSQKINFKESSRTKKLLLGWASGILYLIIGILILLN